MGTKSKYIRVLQFFGDGSIGGKERAIFNLIKSFIDDDTVHIGVAISRGKGLYCEKIKELKVPIIDVNFNSGFSFNVDLKKIKDMKTYDIHHFHDPSPNLILLSLLCGSNVKRVYTRRGGAHDYSKKHFKIKLKYMLNRLLIRHFFDGYSANTKHAASYIADFYKLRHEDIHVLYNGINFNSSFPLIEKQNVFDVLNLDKDDFVIGTACHLISIKRVDLIIRSFSRCQIKNKKLIILGKGNEMDNLTKLVYRLGIKNRVIFMGEVENPSDYMQAMDCFILASGKEESFGNAVVESMLLKIPTIVMDDSSGLKEHVIDMNTGFIAKDEKDLEATIEYIYNNKEIALEIAKSGSEYVSNKYTINNMVRNYKRFYEQVVKQ